MGCRFCHEESADSAELCANFESNQTCTKGEQDTAELGANSDANHTCTIFSLKLFLAYIFLVDANKRIPVLPVLQKLNKEDDQLPVIYLCRTSVHTI